MSEFHDAAQELPAAYEPVWLGEVDCLRTEARRQAETGAGEGTLLIADTLRQPLARAGKTWQSYPDNFHGAILLQPEIPVERYHELLIVGLLSLGQAISEHVSPMTALTYSWPNDINIARNKVASMWIDHGVSRRDEKLWLTLTASVNVAQGPSDFSIPAMSLHEAEGNNEIDRSIVLVSWARQFVTLLNDWADRGFAHTLGLWKVRLDLQQRFLVAQGVERRLVDVDDEGAGVLEISRSQGDARVPLLQWMEARSEDNAFTES